MSARTDIRNWVVRDFRFRRNLAFGGSIACFVGAIFAFLITWVFVQFALFVIIRPGLLGVGRLTLWVWLVMALIPIGYFVLDRNALEKLEFDPAGNRMVRGMMFFPGVGIFALLLSPRSMLAFLQVLALCLMAYPGLAALSWRLFHWGRSLQQADTELIARGLLKLAKEPRKVPLVEYTSMFPKILPNTLLTQMALVDGVIIREEQQPGIYITETLREELIAARNLDD